MKKTWLLGLGFFSISLTWGLYNAFVPLFLDKFLKSTALIGFMMTIDNYFGLFLQPLIGRKSDRTHTRIGKRMPYLLIGMPLAALFTALIPLHTNISVAFNKLFQFDTSFWLLLTFMILMNLSMAFYRSPTVALMPDLTPSHKRTQANGVINFMGGIGSILAFAGGSMLYEKHIALPFFSSAVVTLICLLLLLYFIKEQRDALEYKPYVKPRPSDDHQHPYRIWGRPHQLLRKVKKEWKTYSLEWNVPTIFLLLAIYFWFFSYQGVEALFTLYGTKELGLSDGQATFSLAFFSLAFVIAAIPAGLLGRKYGKRQIIVFGVAGLLLCFATISFVNSLLTLRMLLMIGGVFWAMININSYPFVVALGKESSIGTRTGIYYIASSLAALSSPPLMGLFVDLLGYSSLFIVASIGMGIALLCILSVKDKGISPPIPSMK